MTNRNRNRRRQQGGYAAVLTAVFMSGAFFAVAAISVDVARWYVEVERVQKAADASALAGVTYMPQDLSAATAAAREVSARNGYPDGGDMTVEAERGTKPSELKVTVASRIRNNFGALIGLDYTTISRSATADYTGPQPMGSPCNTYGNEPPGTSLAGPTTSQLSAPPGAACPRTPQFWFTAHGPEVWKTQGDQYSTRVCGGGESGCSGSANNEFRPEGYFLMVRVQPAAVGRSVTLQIYDPAYVETGSRCNAWDTRTAFPNTDNWNPWASSDARTRYARNPDFVTVGGATVAFCAGDDANTNLRRGSGEVPTITSFALRQPTDDLNPTSAAVVDGCTRQWPGYANLTVNQLRRGQSGYNPNLARVFNQWVPLCTFTPTRAGDYYLQVRTNVPLGGSINDPCSGSSAPGPCTGSFTPPNAVASAVTTQAGDNGSVLGNGSNRFAVRAVSSAGQSISIAAYGRMPIFANSDQAQPIFNLIRILPGAASKTLVFKFFDVGDATGNGTMTVLRPTDATGSGIANCTASGFRNATLPSCSLSGIDGDAGWNGQSQTINVPIPPDYSCNFNSPGGCWWRVRVSFSEGSVTDATTWTASINGDPVRLIE